MPFDPFSGYQGARSSNLPPELQQKQMMARYLMQNAGNQQSPTSLGVLARALQGALAGYAQNDATEAAKSRETSYNETMARALRAGSGRGNLVSDTGQWSAPTGNVDPQTMAAVLGSNQDTAPMGLQMQMQGIQSEAELAKALKLMNAKNALEPPKTREVKRDGKVVTEQFDPASRTWQQIAESPQWNPKDANGQETFGNSPIWGTDANGNPVLMQPSNRGGVKPVQLPPGVTPQRGNVTKVDLGDKIAIMDANGSFIGYAPKGLAPEQQPALMGEQATAKAAGTVQGTAQATAAVGLPQVIAQGEQTIKLIDELVNHPAMPSVIGVPGSLAGVASKAGMAVPGSPEASFMARLDQLKGQQFMQAYESLKGGGVITEVEGNKATDAISRMQKTNQSEEEFKKAAAEFQNIIRGAIARARAKAGGPSGAQPSPAASEYDYVPGKGLVPK